MIINDKKSIDDNLFWIVDGTFASESVLTYYSSDGREFKIFLPGQVIIDAISHIESLPVTLNHPQERLVTPETYKDLNVGNVVRGLVFSEGKLTGRVAVCDAEAIEAVKAETHIDLSMGYRPLFKQKQGVFVDEFGVMGEQGKSYPYDYEYTMISYNHVALVEKGRSLAAGLMLDSIDSCLTYTKEDTNSLNQIMTLKSIAIGNEVWEVSNDSAPSILDMIKSYDELKSQLDSMLVEKETLQNQIDAYKAQLDSADKLAGDNQALIDGLKVSIEEIKSQSLDASAVNDAVQARLDAWQEIGGIENDVVAFDASLSPLEIKRKYLQATIKDESKLARINDGEASFIEGVFFGLPKQKTVKQIFAANDSVSPASSYSKPSKGNWKTDGSWSLRK